MRKINKFLKKSSLVLAGIIGIGGVLGGESAYAYTHDLYKPWGSSYQTATYQVQDTFGSTTKTQVADAMIEWKGVLSKQFLYKSSTDTTATQPSQNGTKTITKNDYGADGVLAEHIPYYNLTGDYVVESDIRVNIYYPFANSAQPNTYDIQSVLTHELGHALRVGHSTVTTDTMYTNITMNDVSYRTVTSNDASAAQDSTARWFN